MLKQATVEDISNRRITKIHGRIVVVTHYYPRFLKRNLIDDYARELAPTRELLTEFKEAERASGDHDGAFAVIDYESKFNLSKAGYDTLEKLARESAARPVYLVCHCTIGQCCHREILMLIARERYGAPVARIHKSYDTFLKRLPSLAP